MAFQHSETAGRFTHSLRPAWAACSLSLQPGQGAAGQDAAGLSSRTAFVMICLHLPGPVHTTDLWSVSSGTSSVRPITEVCHPENLLMGPFSLNCKQLGKFECDAINWQ